MPIVHHHHERWDGTGYPRSLREEAIPLGARIFATADAFDAMTCDRPYSRALSLEAARCEIRRCAGSHFDPAVVETFLALPLETLASIRVGGAGGAVDEDNTEGAAFAGSRLESDLSFARSGEIEVSSSARGHSLAC